MLKSYGVECAGGHVVVANVIIVSAQVLLILTLGLWDFGLGLDNTYTYLYTKHKSSALGLVHGDSGLTLSK